MLAATPFPDQELTWLAGEKENQHLFEMLFRLYAICS